MRKAVSLIISTCLMLSIFTVSANQAVLDNSKNIKYYQITYASTIPSNINYDISEVAASKKSFTQTTNNIYEVIYNGLLNFETEIDISKFGITDFNLVMALYNEVVNYYPYLFMASLSILGGYSNIGSNQIDFLCPVYVMDPLEYLAALSEYDQYIKRTISGMSPDFTDLEKIFYVYNKISLDYSYDYLGWDQYVEFEDGSYMEITRQDAYSFFKYRRGVCQGYTLAFTSIMRYLNIDCTSALAESSTPGEAGHTWNIVTLGQNSYHIDATWDTITYSTRDSATGTLVTPALTAPALYNFFLESDDSFLGAHAASAGLSRWHVVGGNLTCTDKSYETGNYIWKNVYSPIVYSKDNWYYINYYSNSYKMLKSSDLITKSVVLQSLGSDFGYYSGLFSIGDTLYYNTKNRIMTYNTTTSAKTQIANFTNYNPNKIFRIFFNGYENKLDGNLTSDNIGEIAVIADLDFSPQTNNDVKTQYYQLNIKGDLDGNKKVDSSDLTLIKKTLTTGKADFNWGFADFGGDEGIDIKDYIRMKKIAAGK